MSDAQAYLRAIMIINGTGDQELNQAAGTIDQGAWSITKDSGTVTQTSNLSLPSTLTFTKGTYTTGNYSLTVAALMLSQTQPPSLAEALILH